MMVLYDYRQAYVGTAGSSNGVVRRIRQHWSSTKQFDRLLFGNVEESILAIDSFRALDTTRLFAALVRDPFGAQLKLVERMPREYLLNRIMSGGGKLVGFAARVGADWRRTRELRPVGDLQE